MSDPSTEHATFSVERVYDASPERTFAAWSDPAAKSRWYSDPEAIPLIERVGAASSLADTLVELGYDALDWRPVLRQIRTRLIGEMSGYGGPNITTRAGTRKV